MPRCPPIDCGSERPLYCVPFPHPKPGKDDERNKNEPGRKCGARDLGDGAVDIAEDRDT
jgi:hypothetical protein